MERNRATEERNRSIGEFNFRFMTANGKVRKHAGRGIGRLRDLSLFGMLRRKGVSMATFDPAIIEKFATKLYAQANQIIGVCTIIGAVIGGAGGYFLAKSPLMDQSQNVAYGVAGVGALMFGAIGFSIGQAKAFMLKLQAQQALCQLKIEQNTRAKS